MNKKRFREKVINTGFMIELALFILSGVLFAHGKNFKFFIAGIVVLISGMFMAYWVGEKIEKNAVINYQDREVLSIPIATFTENDLQQL